MNLFQKNDLSVQKINNMRELTKTELQEISGGRIKSFSELLTQYWVNKIHQILKRK